MDVIYENKIFVMLSIDDLAFGRCGDVGDAGLGMAVKEKGIKGQLKIRYLR